MTRRDDWLTTVSWHAQTLRRASTGFVVVALVALAIAAAHVWGTLVGARDAALAQQAERAAMLNQCRQQLGDDAAALVDQRTGALTCVSGSNRFAPQKGLKR